VGVELAPRAVRDLRRLRGSADLKRIRSGLEALGQSVPGLDIRPLEGRAPWRRLRVGDWRVLFRLLAEGEHRQLGRRSIVLVARVIHRRELDRAVKGL
jgi:mRNA-degrading endonuclease RelE of RelBE toxin-antitoxin system